VCWVSGVCSGTFSKKSRVITGRRPFALDTAQLNYDYDSEAEWEEEDPDGECSAPARTPRVYHIVIIFVMLGRTR
jgi:hypothetical protein